MQISSASSPSPRIVACLVMTFLLLAPIPTMAEGEPGLFFLMGSGRLHLKNLRNGREARVELLKADEEVTAALPVEVIEEKFNLDYHFKQVDTIFARVFGN